MLELQYPIGKFLAQDTYTTSEIVENIKRIEWLPAKLTTAIQGLNDSQLDTPYREGGWTVRQVVHHVSDSHLNAFIRLKWTLTEDSPIIKAYEEKAWALTPEVSEDPQLSIALLKALHTKWVTLLKKLSEQDWQKYFTHPQTQKQVKLVVQLAMYAWHGEHHLAHITRLKERMDWK
jgi:uncharacterized damage-inducible protein DinB